MEVQMTIFAERNKKGQPTGVWFIEIRKVTGVVSRTIRRRSRNYTEAMKVEVELRGSLESTPGPDFPPLSNLMPSRPTHPERPMKTGRVYLPLSSESLVCLDDTLSHANFFREGTKRVLYPSRRA